MSKRLEPLQPLKPLGGGSSLPDLPKELVLKNDKRRSPSPMGKRSPSELVRDEEAPQEALSASFDDTLSALPNAISSPPAETKKTNRKPTGDPRRIKADVDELIVPPPREKTISLPPVVENEFTRKGTADPRAIGDAASKVRSEMDADAEVARVTRKANSGTPIQEDEEEDEEQESPPKPDTTTSSSPPKTPPPPEEKKRAPKEPSFAPPPTPPPRVARDVVITHADAEHSEALRLAVSDDSVAAVSKLVLKGGIGPSNEGIFVHLCASLGSVTVLKWYVDVFGPSSLLAKDQASYTPLHWAAENGHSAVCDYLLGVSDVNINAQSEDGMTALHLAADNGHLDVVKLLVLAGADMSIQDNEDYSAYNYAVLRKHTAVRSFFENPPDLGAIARSAPAAEVAAAPSDKKSEEVASSDGEVAQKAPSAPSLKLDTSAKADGRLKVFTGTWNLHGLSAVEVSIVDLVPVGEFDIYVVGTQECEQSIEKAMLFNSKKNWEAKLASHLGEDYVMLAAHTLQAIHIATFARKAIQPNIARISTSQVATGVGDVLGNKGGVAMAFLIGHTSFVFIVSHFTAHQEKVNERNNDYHRIKSGLFSKTEPPAAAAAAAAAAAGPSTQQPSPTSQPVPGAVPTRDITNEYSRVFWLGDLNYRINGNRKAVDALLKKNMFEVLVANDQLTVERCKGVVFEGFYEGPLSFHPTYKFDPNTDTYDSSAKARIPAWTDRILYKTTQPGSIELLNYTSVPSLKCSDHRPVVAYFAVSCDGFDNDHLVSTPLSPVTRRANEDKKGSANDSHVCVLL